MKKVSFFTLGCRSNYFDTEFMADQFREKGYFITDDADIHIINTCTVTAGADRSSRQAIYRAKRKNPNSIVVVTGCYAQVSPMELLKLKEVDLVIGNTHKGEIVKLVEEFLEEKERNMYVGNIFRESHIRNFGLLTYFEKTRPFLKIQEGCNNFCSFCIIPFARGRVRSIPKEQVLEEVRLLAQRGFKEMVLTGTQLTQYGWDIKTNLYELLKELLRIEGLEIIRLSSLYPLEIDKNLLEVMTSEEKIAPHFHISLQSASDRVLKLMERGYETKDYVKLVEYIIEKRPISAIGTDIIVGFPTEKEEDFKLYLDVLEKLPIAYMHIFPYSDREGTKAYRMGGRIREDIKKERVEILKELDSKKRNEFLEKNRGKELRAIVIEENKLLTENYISLERKGYSSVGELVKIVV
ncbi:MAG: tRNA (N(6)-L-threonylcarbamoyladenosine(37)-C(2))-methylthiotransferase MtaB [Aquificaceae bacterium]